MSGRARGGLSETAEDGSGQRGRGGPGSRVCGLRRGLEEGFEVRVGLVWEVDVCSADAGEDSLEHGAHVRGVAALNTARLACGGCGLRRHAFEDLAVEVRGVRHGGGVAAWVR